MIDLTSLFEFSRQHCIAICAFLVPANLLATLQTMLMVWFRRPFHHVTVMTATSALYAGLLLLHVYTWFAAGVVMAPTFILIALGCVCLTINGVAIALSWRQHVPLVFSRRIGIGSHI